MTPEEQRALAIECGIAIGCDYGDIWYYAICPEELAAYTAAVEAKERERCVEIVLYDVNRLKATEDAHYRMTTEQFSPKNFGFDMFYLRNLKDIANAIRSLK